MTTDTADAIINYIIRLDKGKKLVGNKIIVGFYGGEPLLNMPVLKHIVERLKTSIHNYPLYFNLITNGLLLSGSNLEYIIENHILTKVSFEGDEILQGKLRPAPNGKNAYKIIQSNLEKIPDAAKDLFVVTPSVSRIAEKLDTIIKNYAVSGFKKFSLQFIIDDIIEKNNIRLEDINKISGLMDDVTKAFIDLRITGMNIKVFPNFNYMICLHERTPKEHFYPVVNMEAFGCDGSIYPRTDCLSKRDYCYGSVWTGYNREKLNKVRDVKFFFEECNDCWMEHFCSGLCFINPKSPYPDDEKKIVDCLIQNLLWQSAIRGYIYLNEKTNGNISEFFK